MSASLDTDGMHGVRSFCLLPGEVETSILDPRPSRLSVEERSLMLLPADVAESALFCISLPPGACATHVILLRTADRTVRDHARVIEAMTTA
jgi:hypothetical protein